MGNPTAAQEPSMEEILASIRQIISEDGDASEQEDATEAAGNEPETGEKLDDSMSEDPSVSEMAKDDPADDGDQSGFDMSAEAAADPEPPLANIATDANDDDAQSDGTAEGSSAAFETMDTPAEPEDEGADDLVETGPYESPFDTFNEKIKATEIEAADQSDSAASEAAPEPAPAEIAAASALQSENEASESNDTMSAPANPEISESPAMSATAPQPAEFDNDDKLISPESGATVANAFSTLTHTILSQNARTLDDLVSDMLQPMLKEWLDDNLPTLVERLVKQEIDRMARGGRG